jgi:hypothetical protein
VVQTVTATFADGNVATYRDGVLVTQFLATTPVAVTYPEVILGQTEESAPDRHPERPGVPGRCPWARSFCLI